MIHVPPNHSRGLNHLNDLVSFHVVRQQQEREKRIAEQQKRRQEEEENKREQLKLKAEHYAKNQEQIRLAREQEQKKKQVTLHLSSLAKDCFSSVLRSLVKLVTSLSLCLLFLIWRGSYRNCGGGFSTPFIIPSALRNE